MATVNVYKVHYHFQDGNGKKISPEYIDYLSAAANDYATLKGVLSSNGLLRGPGTLVINSAQNMDEPALS